jgi:hypothetical protein
MLVQSLNDTRDQLRQLMQSRDYRLFLEGQSGIKADIEGRAAVVVVVERRFAAGFWGSGRIRDKDECVNGLTWDIIIVLRHIDLVRCGGYTIKGTPYN